MRPIILLLVPVSLLPLGREIVDVDDPRLAGDVVVTVPR